MAKVLQDLKEVLANPSHSLNLADKLNMFKINPYVGRHGNIVPVGGQGGREKRICHPPCTITPPVKGNNIITRIFLSPWAGPLSEKKPLTIAFKLADVKLETPEAYLLKLEKNLSWNFEVIYILRKNAVLNICRYLKGFYT